jgi:hypothetical protein
MIRSFRPFITGRVRLAFVLTLSAVALVPASTPRFLADDPLAREPESRDASGALPEDVGLLYDLSYHLFVTAQLVPSNVHARNVNTIDEVPDSGWFTNRILARTPSVEEIVRGPNVGPPPNTERWVLIREKGAGFSPGFTAKDANGETWFLSFDFSDEPEGQSSAQAIATKIFWALGYNQIETFITSVDPRRLTIDPKATARRPNGTRTPFRQSDLEVILERAARGADGTYRAVAGRLLPGKVLGPFRYEGTRPDDPNDIVEHEHRRELRALRVFGAWTNLTDLKAGNTLDTLETVDGKSVVRHYLQDVGSSFGVGHAWDEGFEYFYEGGSTVRRLFSFGLALSPWQTAHYAPYRSVGKFENDKFDPVTWKPHTPPKAYMEMRPDDAFWAARRVAAFDDALIGALVHTGQFGDPAAERHFATILAQRRDKVVRAYLPAVNPIVNPRLSAGGELTFENAAVAAGVAQPPAGYRAAWAEFDNATGQARSLGESRGTTAIKAPRELPPASGAFVQIDVSAEGGAQAAWQRPVRLHFRRAADGWTLVGLDRDAGAASGAASTAETRDR